MAPKPPAFGAPRWSRGAPLARARRGGVTSRGEGRRDVALGVDGVSMRPFAQGSGARLGVFCATFSIVGRDAAGAFGIAVSTARPAVGALVPHVCLKGAIATQSFVN